MWLRLRCCPPLNSHLDKDLRRIVPGPIRTCLGCGAKVGKAELVRLVISAGELMIDEAGRRPGRGAYCCRKSGCFQRLMKQRKKLEWALRCQARDKASDLVMQVGLEAQFARMVYS